MLKHAFLITAYNDFDILERCAKMYARLGDVYIHVDKKSGLSEDTRKKLAAIKNTEVVSEYKIYWGSYKHILAVISLAKRARAKKNYDFYHILTGSTFLSVKDEEFSSFFESNADKNFIEIIPVDDRIKERYERFYFLHRYDGRSKKGKRRTQLLLKLQKKLGIKSGRSFPYRGYFYCHLNGTFMDYLLKYLKNSRKYLKSLKTCFIPEEFFFQNIIMKSDFAESVINDHLIYNVWNGLKGSPEELTQKDFEAIKGLKKPFCRKIGQNSLSLIDELENYTLSK